MEQAPSANNEASALVATQKDYNLGILAGFLIGLLALPVLYAAKPELYQKLHLITIPFFLIAVPLGLRAAYFLSKKITPLIWQIAKFGVSGLLNTLVDAGVLMSVSFFLQKALDISAEKIVIWGITAYSLYKAFSFILANINSYFWNKYWTFGKKDDSKSKKEFTQFFVVSIIGFLINVSVATMVFRILVADAITKDQRQLLGAMFGTLVGLAWNFIGYKLWVFKK